MSDIDNEKPATFDEELRDRSFVSLWTNYMDLKEQNTQLKADNMELVKMLSGLVAEYDDLLEKSINYIK